MSAGKLLGPLPTQRILVTGAPRSATTFVGKVLSWPRSVDYLHEPFNPLCGLPGISMSYLDLAGLEGPYRAQLVNEFNDLLRYEPMLRTGRFARDSRLGTTVKTFIGSRGPLYLRMARVNPFSRTVVVKDPLAVLAGASLIEEWGFKQVGLIRHPAAFAASLARVGWRPSLLLADINAQSSVRSRLFPEDLAALDLPQDEEWQSAALLWRITVRELLRVTSAHPSAVLLTHESVSRQPVSVFKALYELFGLPWSDVVAWRIRRLTSGGEAEAAGDRTQSFSRDSRSILAHRLGQVDDQVLEGVWEMTRSVADQWYTSTGVHEDALEGVPDGRPNDAGPIDAGRTSPRPHDWSAAARIRMTGPMARTRTLTDRLVERSCRDRIAQIAAVPAIAGSCPEIEIVTGGRIGPDTDRVTGGWSPRLMDRPRMPTVFMGVGWTDPHSSWSAGERMLASRMLSRHYLHSVRDDDTRSRLNEVGISNVVVTGCPTTWAIDTDRIRSGPGSSALVTFNHIVDAEPFVTALVAMIDDRFASCAFLPLHPADRRFLPLLPAGWIVLPSRVESLDQVLDDAAGELDYIGTSAHVGIEALSAGARPFIIEGDPELGSVAGPIGLETYPRNQVSDLRSATERTMEPRVLPLRRSIEEWCGQFLWAGNVDSEFSPPNA